MTRMTSLAKPKPALTGSVSNPKRRSLSKRSCVTKSPSALRGVGGVTASPLRPVAQFGECASIKIPMPISVNAMYRNVPGVGRVKTKELKAWKLEAEWEVARQKPPRFVGLVDISISLRIAPKGRADCSNYIKGVEDLLVTCGVIEDDSHKYVRSVTARWSQEETACRVNVYHAPETA
jgi:Holliday junction resolvase RusA-like endonuclease